MSITTICYVYRANEKSLGGLIESNTTAVELYEKCFLSTKNIAELIEIIPKNEEKLIVRFKSVNKYMISLFPKYLNRMSKKEFGVFRTLCRKNIVINLKLLKWMSKKNKFLFFFVILIPILKRKVIKIN